MATIIIRAIIPIIIAAISLSVQCNSDETVTGGVIVLS